jgi:hypothetical protein
VNDAIAILRGAIRLSPSNGDLAVRLGYSLHRNRQITVAAGIPPGPYSRSETIRYLVRAGLRRTPERPLCHCDPLLPQGARVPSEECPSPFRSGSRFFGTGDIDSAIDSLRIAAADRSVRRDAVLTRTVYWRCTGATDRHWGQPEQRNSGGRHFGDHHRNQLRRCDKRDLRGRGCDECQREHCRQADHSHDATGSFRGCECDRYDALDEKGPRNSTILSPFG